MQVLCETKIYHPNINLQGNVCLNILREDWKPVSCVVDVGMQFSRPGMEIGQCLRRRTAEKQDTKPLALMFSLEFLALRSNGR